MSSKVPKLSIKIDTILSKEMESKFGVSENSESAKDIFDNAVKNSDDVTKSTIVTENRCLSNADKNIIDQLNDILSDDINFFPSEEVKSTPSPNPYNNYENLESFYLDYLERDESPVDASSSAPSEASNSSLQLQGKQKCSMKEFCSCPLYDTQCSNTFSTQIYTSNEIFENHYINEEFLDEDFFFDTDNNSPKNDSEITSELTVSAVKLSDREILSHVSSEIPKSVENNNKNNNSGLSKELRVVLKKITEEEINKYGHGNAKNNNSSNKNMEICSSKELKVLLTRITDIKSSKLVEEKKNTLYAIQDSEFYQENNSEDLYFDHSCYELQETIKMQLKKKKTRYERKRKIEKNFDDKLKNGKVLVYDGNMSDLNDNEIVVHGKELTPLEEYTGTIVLIKNETILKRSARIYTSTIYKILFAGKYAYNDNYKQTIENFGGKVVSDPKVATVLVAKKVKRTMEFLSAICRGIPIVSLNWIQDCVENHRFVDPNKYLLKNVESEEKYNFNLKMSLKRAREKNLFEGYCFIITSGIQEKSFDQLKYLIEIAGGVVYKNISKNLKPPAMIVTCSKDDKKVQNLMKKKPNFFERVVTITFITDCIVNQEIISE